MRRSVEIKLSGIGRSELNHLERGQGVWRVQSDRVNIVLLVAGRRTESRSPGRTARR